MANEKGGVGVRLFVNGGEVVRRTFDEVGTAGQRMFAQIALGEKAANPALRGLNAVSQEVRTGIDGLASRTGAAGAVLSSFGVAGIASAAALGAIVGAVGQAREAMSFADDIADTSERLKVSTDQLQEFRYAVEMTGGTAQDADAALEGFTQALGSAQAGKAKSVKVFEALGFSKEDIDRVKDAADFMPTVFDRISEIGSEAEQMAAANATGLGSVLTLAREGGDAYQELAQKARDLGIIMDADLVAKGAEAEDQFATLSRVLDIELKSAFVELAPFITDLMRGIVSFAKNSVEELKALAAFARRVSEFNEKYDPSRLGQAVRDRALGRTTAPTTATLDSMSGDAGAIYTSVDPSAPPTKPGARGFNLGKDPADDAAKDAKREADKAARDAKAEADRLKREQEAEAKRIAAATERYQDQRVRNLRQAEDARNRVEFGPGRSLDDRQINQLEQLRIQRLRRMEDLDGVDAEARKAKVSEDIITAQRRELNAALAVADAAEDRELRIVQALEQQDEALRVETQQAEAVAAMLGYQLDLAGTQKERREIALQQIEVERAALRAALVQKLERDKALNPTDRARQLESFDAGTEAAKRGARLGTMGPGEAFAYELNEAARRGDEAFEDITVNGLRSLEDGLLDVMTGARSVQEVFANMAQSIIADLTRIAIQRAIIKPIADMLFGPEQGSRSGGGSTGNLLTSVLKVGASIFGGGRAPGRALGGMVDAGQAYELAEYNRPELALATRPGQVFSSDDTVRILRDAVLSPANDTGRGGAVSITMPTTMIVQGSVGPTEAAMIQARLDRMEREAPARAVAAVRDATIRSHGYG